MSGYRWWLAIAVLLAAAFESAMPRDEAPIPPAQLQMLPASLAGWTAEDVPIEPRLVTASRVDSYLSRIYHREPAEEIGLYVGYYKSQRAGDAVHSPKNCLPGAGWQSVRSSRIAFTLRQSASPEANLYIVENEHQRYVVLYWYQSHGTLIASEYRAKLQTMHDAITLHRTDSALVRITVPVAGDEASAIQSAVAFAELIAPRLNQVLPR
jgi:EpsI family protein